MRIYGKIDLTNKGAGALSKQPPAWSDDVKGRPTMETLTCAECGVALPLDKNPSRIYCSRECQRNVQRRKTGRLFLPIPSGTIGALHELVICADLMRRGWNVFRAMSPSCPCDLIVYRSESPLFRVEVRTAQRRADGEVYRQPNTWEIGRYDVRALVCHDGEIIYEPDVFGAFEDGSQ